jgi:hypothetical protein
VTPPEVLSYLQSRGFRLRLTPAGAIGVAPSERLAAADVELIRTHRAGLIALLSGSALVQSCWSCAHRTKVKTCSEPEAAGLADRFCLVWIEHIGDHGLTCKAYRPAAGQRTAPPGQQPAGPA